MPYRMGTDTSGTQAAWIGPSREIQTSTSVCLGVERVGLVLSLWRCRSFDPSRQSEILDAGTLCVASDRRRVGRLFLIVFAARGCQGVSLPPVEARNKGFRPFEVSRRVRRARQPDLLGRPAGRDSSTEAYLGRPEGSPPAGAMGRPAAGRV